MRERRTSTTLLQDVNSPSALLTLTAATNNNGSYVRQPPKVCLVGLFHR